MSDNPKLLSQQNICTVAEFILVFSHLSFAKSFSDYSQPIAEEHQKSKHNIQPWYVSMERVWHALRACVVNSNGTTDPQLDLWADSTHPPTRPSVLLCIGKQAWCTQRLMSTRCKEDTCDSLGSSADLTLQCFFFFLVHYQLQNINISLVLRVIITACTTWL